MTALVTFPMHRCAACGSLGCNRERDGEFYCNAVCQAEGPKGDQMSNPRREALKATEDAPDRRVEIIVRAVIDFIQDGKPEGLRAFGAAFENALIDMLEDEKPDRVVTAASLPPTAQTHAMTMECQVGLLMLTRTACYRHRVQHVIRAETTARKHVLGRGTFRSSEEAKAAVMAWAVGRGWSPSSHDAADALVMWWNEMSLAGAFARVAA